MDQKKNEKVVKNFEGKPYEWVLKDVGDKRDIMGYNNTLKRKTKLIEYLLRYIIFIKNESL